MTTVERRYVEARKRLHHATKIVGLRRRHEQLKVVVEQRIGMHRHSMLRAAPAQGQHELFAINIRHEGQAAMRGTLDHVVGVARQHEAFESGHVER